MKIAQVVRRFAFEEWGGTETVVWNTSLGLQARGNVTEILATQACSTTPGTECRDGVKIMRFPYFYPNFPLSAEKKIVLDKKGGNPYCFGLRARLLNSDCELIHIHTLGRTAQFARDAAMRRHIPYLISLHGGCFDVPSAEITSMISPLAHTLPYGGIIDRLRGWRADVFRDAAAVICVGANELPELRKRYPDTRSLYLPNGVSVAPFRKKSQLNLRAELHLPPDSKILLCISRIDYQKNQLRILDAASEIRRTCPQIHVLMAGPVSAPDYPRELRLRAEQLGLAGKVTLLPGISPGSDLLYAAYQQSDAFLLPSRHEPFGIVVLEAWAAGLPVIASGIGGLKHLITNGVTGFLCGPDDTSAQVDAWNALQNPEMRARITDAASKAVEEYDWSRISARLEHLYAEILEERRPR